MTLTNGSISGSGTLVLDYGDGADVFTFTGSGPNFDLNANIDPNQPNSDVVASIIVLNKTTGTQTFGGTIGDYTYRMGEGGTSEFTSNVEEQLYVEGGTAVLSGPNGAMNDPAIGTEASKVLLEGGALVLDNTTANNNNRLNVEFLDLNGGNLTLLGANGGATNEYNNFPRGTGQTTGPVFGEGLNVFTVHAGTGTSSYASYTFPRSQTPFGNAIVWATLLPRPRATATDRI